VIWGGEGGEGVGSICILAGWVMVLCSGEVVCGSGGEGQWSSGFCFSVSIIDNLA